MLNVLEVPAADLDAGAAQRCCSPSFRADVNQTRCHSSPAAILFQMFWRLYYSALFHPEVSVKAAGKEGPSHKSAAPAGSVCEAPS